LRQAALTGEPAPNLTFGPILRPSHASRYGVEGIEFDLNHPDLDHAEWEPISLLGDNPMVGIEPQIELPWSDLDLIARLRNSVPVLKIEPGDRLTIFKVESTAGVQARGALDHPHHRERRAVYLGVSRDDGPTIPIAGVWSFGGVADVMTPLILRDLDGVQRALLTRFERMIGLEDVLDDIRDCTEDAWTARFKDRDRETSLAARMLWKVEDLQHHAALAFGYLIGRAEAREGRKVQAKTASKGLRRTGDPARRAAIAEIDKTPNILLQRCAENVAEKLEKTARTIRATILPLLAEAEDGTFRPDPVQVEAFRERLGPEPSVASN
jgi:hypothetical protein